MTKKKNLIFFLLLFILANCSFDSKTGIWETSEDEKRRVLELEQKQNELISTEKIYSSENIFTKEKILSDKINLSKPKKNSSWAMSALNHQNFIGNNFITGTDNIFLKKKIGKNKFSLSKIMTSPLIYEDNIIIADSNGTIFNISLNGQVNWKKNIYKKIYKKVYKNLTISIYENNIYVADNIGFIYSMSLDNGQVLWIKNHGIPLKSKIKIFNNKIFLINQDNRILSLNTKDGGVIWNIRSISSFIKSQNLLSIAFTKQGGMFSVTSSGDLLKIDSSNGQIVWTLNTLGSTLAHATDFFRSSDIVVHDENIIFSTHSSIFSYDQLNGYTNWEKEISSIDTPIVDGKNIFLVTSNGFFVIMDIESGNIISATNILKVLKKKKQKTRVTSFIMGSGKIYSFTLNGHLIISSASSGKVENFKKIGDPVTSSPIISDGKLYIYTEDSRILGFN